MEKERNKVLTQDGEASAVEKLEYEAPTVTELGRVEEMTQGGASFEV